MHVVTLERIRSPNVAFHGFDLNGNILRLSLIMLCRRPAYVVCGDFTPHNVMPTPAFNVNAGSGVAFTSQGRKLRCEGLLSISISALTFSSDFS